MSRVTNRLIVVQLNVSIVVNGVLIRRNTLFQQAIKLCATLVNYDVQANGDIYIKSSKPFALIKSILTTYMSIQGYRLIGQRAHRYTFASVPINLSIKLVEPTPLEKL